MTTYSIDTSFTEYSNEEVFYMIKAILSNKFKEINTPYKRILSISYLMNYITNDNLLNSTIRLLKESNLLQNEKQIESPLNKILSNIIYSVKDCTRIRALVYSTLLAYEIKIITRKEVLRNDIPELRFEIENRVISNNMESVDISLKTKAINNTVENAIRVLEPQTQKNEFKKMIVSMAEIDYSNDTDFFKKDISYLTILKDNFIDVSKKEKVTIENKNILDDIFKEGAFDTFKSWMTISKDRPDQKISFIFKKLEQENKLRKTSFKELIEWSKENNFIDDENYNKLTDEACFYSPSKILTKSRLILYNSILAHSRQLKA